MRDPRKRCTKLSIASFSVAVPDKIFGLTLFLHFIDRCHYDSLRAGFAGCSLAWRLRAHIAQVASSATGSAPIAPPQRPQ